MKRITEDELIAYQMGELSMLERARVRRALENDAELAAEAEEIQATLRAFAAEPIALPSSEVIERSWQRVRGGLLVLEPAAVKAGKRWSGGFWVGTAAGFVATMALLLVVAMHSLRTTQPSGPGTPVQNASASAPAGGDWSHRLLAELHARVPGMKAKQLNDRPGPLTTAPVDAVADDPALAAHLDTAERVLTEVSHTQGPLPESTRDQVHTLLLQNAVYRQSAETRGDLTTASVMDDLGRVLTSLDAEPQGMEFATEHERNNPDAFRLQMSIGGVLLDLRILHHGE